MPKFKKTQIMKKMITQIAVLLILPFFASAQLIYDNGPLVNGPGQGLGGADASYIETATGLSTFGFGHATSTGYRIADDFEIPAGATWHIDSLIFFAYQTGSTTTSTITDLSWAIWDASPATGGNIIAGDQTANDLDGSYWSNIYRTQEADLQNIQRPVMANRVATVGQLTLGSGTYWLDWQTGGSLSSGPWAPPITINGVAATGNGLQFDGTTWTDVLDGATSDPQGFPFLIYGTVTTGVNENQLASGISISPNPASDLMSIKVSGAESDITIEVTNTLGQVVYSALESGAIFNHQVDVSGWTSGVYLVTLSSAGKKINQKVVIR